MGLMELVVVFAAAGVVAVIATGVDIVIVVGMVDRSVVGFSFPAG